ncbi:MAG: lysophospholipid acyltransferase family protein [Phreatobacter sp.]|uniref:lysophospholipid acyltransferase family protein n=1 Tax=Phreatobacter sp. TaxID=1966341 RepID=UPI001A5720A5|nr:lysophospholipid acyltransferase family protein [Phreatobacter sp.]
MSFLKKLGRSPAVRSAAGSFLAGYLRLVWRTGRFALDPPNLHDYAEANLPVIFAMWHGQHFLTPFVKRPEYDAVVLISRSADGEMNAIAAEKLGIRAIRGSGDHSGQFARKGGVGAYFQMVEALEAGTTVALTADVPKIARKAGLGIVMLAKQSGRPILPIAIATKRRIDLKSWDKASVNLPFSRGAVVAGPPVWVPCDADAEALEGYRLKVEQAMNDATARAYDIAEGRATPAMWSEATIDELAASREATAALRAGTERRGRAHA